MRPMKAGVTLVALALVGGVLAPSALARVAVIGPPKLTTGSGASTCLAATCTVANARIPGAVVRAPFRGRITRWKVRTAAPHDMFNNDGPVRLQVLKRTDDPAGFDADAFMALRQTKARAVDPDSVNVFRAHLRIRKGQFIGLLSTDDTEIRDATMAGAIHFQWWDPALALGEPATAADFTYTSSYMLFNARVER
jgi:hypothetical protein